MNDFQQPSEATLKRRLKVLYAIQYSLTLEQIIERNNIEEQLWKLHCEKHPPVHTPANFIEKQEDW